MATDLLIDTIEASDEATGLNNANNTYDSALVAANRDGSLLERSEYEIVNSELIKGVVGALTQTADHTTDTATLMKLIRWLDQNIGAFDGGADPQGSIYRALGVDTTNSIKALIDALDTKVDSILAMNPNTIVRKTVTFDGSAGNGAVGTVALFTVTGLVKMRILAVCTENIAGAGTLAVGISGTADQFIAQITGTDLDNGEIWHDATPDKSIELDSVSAFQLNNGNAIIATVGTDVISDGTIIFVCEYVPLTSGASVVAA